MIPLKKPFRKRLPSENGFIEDESYQKALTEREATVDQVALPGQFLQPGGHPGQQHHVAGVVGGGRAAAGHPQGGVGVEQRDLDLAPGRRLKGAAEGGAAPRIEAGPDLAGRRPALAAAAGQAKRAQVGGLARAPNGLTPLRQACS